MFDIVNNTLNGKYNKDYLLTLDNDLENLKMNISERDVYGNANLKEVPDINYKKLINSLSKLKIDVESEDAEVISELVEDNKDNEIKIINKNEMNDTKEYGLDIDEFIKDTRQNEINLKIPNFNDVNNYTDKNNKKELDGIPNLSKLNVNLLNKMSDILSDEKIKTNEILEKKETPEILLDKDNRHEEKMDVNSISDLASSKYEFENINIPILDNIVKTEKNRNNKNEKSSIKFDFPDNLQIPSFNMELSNKNEDNPKTNEPQKIDIDKVLDNLRQKNEEKRKRRISNTNWFEQLKVPSINKNDILNNTLEKNDILIENNICHNNYDFNIKKEDINISNIHHNNYDFNTKKEDITNNNNNKQQLLNNKYKIRKDKINSKVEYLQYEKIPKHDLQDTNLEANNYNELNKLEVPKQDLQNSNLEANNYNKLNKFEVPKHDLQDTNLETNNYNEAKKPEISKHDLQNTNLEANNYNELNKFETPKHDSQNNNLEANNYNESNKLEVPQIENNIKYDNKENDTTNAKSFLQRIKSDNIYNIDE